MTAKKSEVVSAGPLHGLRVIELASIGPGPFGAMLLADLGAEVIRVDRPGRHAGNPVDPEHDSMNRGRRSIQLDLKSPTDLATAKLLIQRSDILLEGFRPGVTERLGLGPDECLALNPRLVYGRMTGWGQSGPLADRAGHDINYIALAGALDPIGQADRPPTIPLNLVGDFGGGGMLLAVGVLAAAHHAARTGVGQVVDAAIVDGTALLTTMMHTWRHEGLWKDQRGANMLDGGAHFYQVYETRDRRFLAVGAVEPQFYAQFVVGLGESMTGDWEQSHSDSSLWSGMIPRVAEIIKARTLDDWLTTYEGTDACVTPALSPSEAITADHNHHRGTFITIDGVPQPAPAPRFSKTPSPVPLKQPRPGEHSSEIRRELEDESSPP